jgi:ParB/RepB/Spo0J family partition protein
VRSGAAAGDQGNAGSARVIATATESRKLDEIIVGTRHRRDLGDVAALSMAELGLLHPVVVRPDGTLIAGERRLRAAQLLGWAEIPVTVMDLDAVARGKFADNSHRKDFTLSESVAIKRALEPIERAAARERMASPEKFSGQAKGNELDKVAIVVGKHRTTLAKAEAVVEAAEAEPEKYGKLKADMDRTGRANGVFRRLRNTQAAEQICAEPPPLPGNTPYRAGMVDIPWAYEPEDEDDGRRGVLPYPTKNIEQACALDVGSIMHADSVLGFWVTNFILVQGLHLPVLRAWRFEPKTQELKGQTEHLVIATRGKPIVTLTDETTLLHGPFHLVQKAAHSAKSIEAYSFFERLIPASHYADLFSRVSAQRALGLSRLRGAGSEARMRGRGMTIPPTHHEHPIIIDARNNRAFFVESAASGSMISRDSRNLLKRYAERAREVIGAMQHAGCTLHVSISASGRLTGKLSDGRRFPTDVVILFVVEHENVVPEIDDLFPDALPKVWRWRGDARHLK